MDKYLEQEQELRDLAQQIFSASRALQSAAATILEVQKQQRDKRLLQEMLDRISAGRLDIEDIVAFYLGNDVELEDTPTSVTETGQACPVSFGGNGREEEETRVVQLDRPDYEDPAACED